MAEEQTNVAQLDQRQTEATCELKHEISTSRECHFGPVSEETWSMGPVRALCCTQLVYPQQILF